VTSFKQLGFDVIYSAGVYVPQNATYDDFVRVSKEIMRGRTSDEQRDVIKKVLLSLLPEQAPGVFR
jgi:hypothetical protein